MDLSICITSCNRLKYLKSLLLSLEEFKNDVQIIVADMGSIEQGLKEYLQSLDWVETYFHNEPRDPINDEYKGRNKLIEMSKHQTLMFLQDDAQFIGNKDVLQLILDDFYKMDDTYVLDIYGVRKTTLTDKLDSSNCIDIDGRKYWAMKDRHYPTTGIYKREVNNKIGLYPTDWELKRENWGRSETWYSYQYKQIYPNGQTRKTPYPLMLSIWNDFYGSGYAFIRGDHRYGLYLDPVHESGLYYEKNMNDIQFKPEIPLGFVDVAKPLGWNYMKDKFGEQKKYSQWEIIDNETWKKEI